MPDEPLPEELAKLERELEALPAEPPREGFQGELEEVFLEGDEPASRQEGEDRTDEAVDTEFEDRLRRSVPPPVARQAFRAALENEFLGGLGEDLSAPPLRPLSKRRRWAVMVLAAAAALVVTLVPHQPEWQVLYVEDDATVELAGIPYSGADLYRIGQVLTEGGSVVTDASPVEFELPGRMRLRVLEHTRMTVSELPDLEARDMFYVELESGAFYLATPEGVAGNPIRVRTPEALVDVTGTVFGVLSDEEGTCTCVSRGRVEVRDLLRGGRVEVGVETTHLAYKVVEQEPLHVPFGPRGASPHTDGLLEFTER